MKPLSVQRLHDASPPSYKVCTKCGDFLPTSSFHKHSQATNGLHSRCKPCRSQDAAQYNRDHQEDRAAQARDWYYRNREQRLRQIREYKRANRAKIKLQDAEYRRTHTELFSRATKRWRAKNLEECRRRGRAYAQAHPEQVRQSARTRRLRKLGVRSGGLSSKQWQAIQELWGGRCAYCRRAKGIEQEHIVPLAKGGQHIPSNVVPACRSCNAKKGANPPTALQAKMIF